MPPIFSESHENKIRGLPIKNKVTRSKKQGRGKENSQDNEASPLPLWTGLTSKSTHSMKKIEDSPEGMSSRAKTRTDRWSNNKNMYGFIGKLKKESMINI